MITRAQLGFHSKNDLHVIELIAFEYAARHFGADAIAITRGVGQVHQIVLSKFRMQGNVQQAALPGGGHRGQAADRLRIEFEILADYRAGGPRAR